MGRRLKYRLKRNAGLFYSPVSPEQEEAGVSRDVIDNLEHIHEREINKLKEQVLRSRADIENFRKRSTRERQEITKFANESLISSLLPTLDNFVHAIKAKDATTDFESFKQGVDIIHQGLLKILRDAGLEKIEALDKTFDPHLHEAMATTREEDKPDNHVIDVIRDGFILKGRVIRPAMVRVNKKPEEFKPPQSGMKPGPQIKPEPLHEDRNEDQPQPEDEQD